MAEEKFEDEPGVGRAFTDATVGDCFLIGAEALALVKLAQRVGILERAVFIDGLCPGNVDRARDVAAALRGLGHARWGDNLAGVFVNGAYVHKIRLALA